MTNKPSGHGRKRRNSNGNKDRVPEIANMPHHLKVTFSIKEGTGLKVIRRCLSDGNLSQHLSGQDSLPKY